MRDAAASTPSDYSDPCPVDLRMCAQQFERVIGVRHGAKRADTAPARPGIESSWGKRVYTKGGDSTLVEFLGVADIPLIGAT